MSKRDAALKLRLAVVYNTLRFSDFTGIARLIRWLAPTFLTIVGCQELPVGRTM
jgi:hypothetical protein